MKVNLVLQEGPGAGHSYVLDPAQQPVYSVGRSSECHIVLDDHRASRHHSDFRWNGRQWEVVDRGSTNGTYVNGMQVHQAYDLRVGDRITIGETTMVLREVSSRTAQQPQALAARQAASTMEGSAIAGPIVSSRPGRPPVSEESSGAEQAGPLAASRVAFWLVQGLGVVAVVCLASGAFLPWVQVTGSLSSELQPQLQGIANLIASLSGQESILNVNQRIMGMQGYGKLSLAIAILSTLALVVDIFFYRRSVVPGIVHLGSGLLAAGAIGFDVANYFSYYERMRDLTVLFGIQLTDVVQFLDQYIDFKIELMAGLYLTGAGLLLLLITGIGRIIVAIMGRER